MSELEDLIDRVEALSGADREVDAAICVTTQYGGLNSEGATNVRVDLEWGEDELIFEIGEEECCNPIPNLTSSIDAALAFAEWELPEGTNIMLKLLTKGKYYHAEFEDIEFESGEVEDVTAYNQPTLPLAIILATLKAKVSE